MRTSIFPANKGRTEHIYEQVNMDRIKIAKHIYKSRIARKDFLPLSIFGEPAWDILIDLFIAESDDQNITVSSACIASQVPSTTALRYIAMMEKEGLVRRSPDERDQRKIHLTLNHSARVCVEHVLDYQIALLREIL